MADSSVSHPSEPTSPAPAAAGPERETYAPPNNMPPHQSQGPMLMSQPAAGPYQQPLMPFPDHPEVSKPWQIAKIVLRACSIVCSIVVIGLGAALIARYGYSYYGSSYVVGVVAIIPTSVAIIWNVAELITLAARRFKAGIHPGAHVALHLLLWLGLAAVLGIGATLVAFDASDLSSWDYYHDDSDYYYYSHYSPYDDHSKTWYETSLKMEEAVVAFLAINLILEFILFVRACVETDIRNKATRNMSRPIYVIGPNGHATPAGMNFMPMQQQMQQQNPHSHPALHPHMMPQPNMPQAPTAAAAPQGQQGNYQNAYGYYMPMNSTGWTQQPQHQQQPHHAGQQPAEAGPSNAAESS